MSGLAASIDVVRAEAANLEDLAPGWDDLYPDEQTDFEIDWSNAMAALREVEGARAAGKLAEDEERAYGPVRARVVALLPTIERLELPKPGVPLT